MSVVFEGLSPGSRSLVDGHVRAGMPVLIAEPFYAPHHRLGVRFFPPALPPFARGYIESGRVRLLKCSDIGANEIWPLATDRAVGVLEDVFPVYRRRHALLIDHVCRTLGTDTAQDGFKIALAERLSEFFSVNMFLAGARGFLGPGPILAYLSVEPSYYLVMKALLAEAGVPAFEHNDMELAWGAGIPGRAGNRLERLGAVAFLSLHCIAGCLMAPFGFFGRKAPESFVYGTTLVSPRRQLGNNRRGPYLLADGERIRIADMVCLATGPLTRHERSRLNRVPGQWRRVPGPAWFFSNGGAWAGLLLRVLREWRHTTTDEIRTVWSLFQNYFIWSRFLRRVGLKKLVTHCDFGAGQVGRNIALREAGTDTWYFTDSANGGWNWEINEPAAAPRHPFWCCLGYDHLVTWSQSIADYFVRHPGSFRRAHVVGCLWSSHIGEKSDSGRKTSIPWEPGSGDVFVVACFDSTYTVNGITSYEEGIEFAEHIRRLVESIPGLVVLFKEKKSRELHARLDEVMGPRLLRLYDDMAITQPGIRFCRDDADSSELISMSDLVISFPFTSTTFEALSVNRPAVWHDPTGRYRNTPNGEVAGAVTFGYDELARLVAALKSNPAAWRNPYPPDSPLMDPYRDGKALDRFRNLLISSFDADTGRAGS